jgi:superoxide reductase
MEKVGDLFKSNDWKIEKHVPVIECADVVAADEIFPVKVSIGKEIAHPNTTEHHIRWIQILFKPSGQESVYQVGNFEFTAHGESGAGANSGPVYTNHSVTAELKVSASGTIYAMGYCNIHGIWENAKAIEIK